MNRKSLVQCLAIGLILAAGIVYIYGPSSHFSYVTYDDQNYVINNYNVNHGLSWATLKWSFNAGYCSNWHPLTWLSHALDSQLFGLNFGAMHVVNFLLHIAASILLYIFLRQATGAEWRPALVAAFFAWHPLHVESVAWISERKDVLSAVFLFLTLIAYLRYTRGSAISYPLALGLYALGLMAKPMLVTLPFLLLFLDFWPLNRLDLSQFSAPRFAKLCLEKIPFLLLALASSILTMIAQTRGGAVLSLQFVPISSRILTALIAYVQYLVKLAWPTGLSVIYPYNNDPSVDAAIGCAFVLVVITAVTLVFWRRRPWLTVGWLWYLGMLVPVIGLVQVGAQALADRYTYLPSIGIFILVCWQIAEWVQTRPAARVAASALAAVALIGCLLGARAQAQSWRDGGSLFRRAIEVNPDNYIAHASYASYLFILGDLDQAERECHAALRSGSSYSPAHTYLGEIALQRNHLDEAASELNLALRLDADNHDAHLLLAIVYLAQNLPQDAATQYQIYLNYNATDPTAHYGLGQALAAQGKWDEAVREFTIALPALPNFAEAHANLAVALANTGRLPEAIDQYHAALHFNTNHLVSLNNLAWILAANSDAKLRNGAEAITLAQRACELTKYTYPQFIGTLAAAYAEAGRFDDATNAAQKAHDVALSHTNAAVADRNLQLLQLYSSGKAFHEQ